MKISARHLLLLLVAPALLHNNVAAALPPANASESLLHTNPANPCFHSNREIESAEYLIGSPGKPGSIYGECQLGQLVCYQEQTAHGLNTSALVVPCPTSPPRRRLPGGKTADEICVVNGKRIRGVQYFKGEAPYTIGSYFAMCNERTTPPSLTCFMDDGLVDSREPKVIVDCSEATRASASNSRLLGTWDENIAKRRSKRQTGGLWPKGVVCYEMAPGTPADFYDTVLKPVFDEYKTKACIQFKTLAECKAARGEGKKWCNGCKHAMQVQVPDTGQCASNVGYIPLHDSVWKRINQRFKKLVGMDQQRSRQVLILGSKLQAGQSVPFCHEFGTVAHEIGHTVGLLHDHQRPNSNAIINFDYFEQMGYGVNLNKLNTLAMKSVAPAGLNVQEQKEYYEMLGILAGLYVDWGVQPHSIGGEYDSKSIMRYSYLQGVCLSKSGTTEGYCDIFNVEGCKIGQDADCKDEPKPAKKPSQKDYDLVKQMYDQRGAACTIQ